ncbi:MAG: molybdopterin molybdotransferase MoeA [Pelagimonas sp.]|uniref:molybdopterin molybdotransferase MoeA n=1 Tax=Pelagimonas sp. TaxID=2073170 RepID=UPI003D6A63EC
MISVSDALDHLFALANPLGSEEIPLIDAAGRVMVAPVRARRDQPPFAASAMDGYGTIDPTVGQKLEVIGEAAAGHRFDGEVTPGTCIRIFTGAPVPENITHVTIQENVTRDGDHITINDLGTGDNIRPAGGDFKDGQTISSPRRLTANDVALLAAMNIPTVTVARQPKVALISTGDELVMPGENPGPDQIIASNTFGLHAMLRNLGAMPRLLPIARDNEPSLRAVFDLVDDADLVITIGGASVGDHDLVAKVAGDLGMERAFYKVAMRPGKPLMSGRLGDAMMMGLPGNPVSAMVCGHVFVAPVVRAMQGLGHQPALRYSAQLAAPLVSNGPREHYMRADVTPEGLTAFERQDSSLLSVLGASNALLVRAPHDPPRSVGEKVDYIPL